MRSPDQLLESAIAVIDLAFLTPAIYSRRTKNGIKTTDKFPAIMVPLFSSGHDSTCACHVASRHPKFDGKVHFINTGIGAIATYDHAVSTAIGLGWDFREYRSPDTYEKFVIARGFPGPAMHQWAYIRLKERCVRMMVKGKRVALITGCRSQESTRRMGHVEPVKVGEWETHKDKATGEEKRVQVNKNRTWVAPCHDWSSDEQRAYMEEFDLPLNPVKLSLGMSGECFCGAFAAPGEIDRIRHHCPDVAEKIDRLSEIARQHGKHSVWGTRPPKENRGIIKTKKEPLCSSCHIKARLAGITFQEEICASSPSTS